MVRAPAIIDALHTSASSADILAESREDCVWYLAVRIQFVVVRFQRQRGIVPLDAKNVYVKGVELTLDLPGLPYLEPRFANCRLVEEAGPYTRRTGVCRCKEKGGGRGVGSSESLDGQYVRSCLLGDTEGLCEDFEDGGWWVELRGHHGRRPSIGG